LTQNFLGAAWKWKEWRTEMNMRIHRSAKLAHGENSRQKSEKLILKSSQDGWGETLQGKMSLKKEILEGRMETGIIGELRGLFSTLGEFKQKAMSARPQLRGNLKNT